MLTPTLTTPDAPISLEPSGWSETLAPYARPNPRRSALDIATSVVPYIALWVLMYLSLRCRTADAGARDSGGRLSVRTFIVFHDCTHGSFMRSKRANAWVGTTLGLIVFRALRAWKLRPRGSITRPPAISTGAGSGTSDDHGRRVRGQAVVGKARLPAVS